MSKYTVQLLHKTGYVIADKPADTLAEAKQSARYMTSEEYARQAETTRKAEGSEKVEVRNQAGECVFDVFVSEVED